MPTLTGQLTGIVVSAVSNDSVAAKVLLIASHASIVHVVTFLSVCASEVM